MTTKPTPHKWAKEIHAFADGYVVQGLRHGELRWNREWVADKGFTPPFSCPDWKFRIKPQEPDYVEIACAHWNRAKADDYAVSVRWKIAIDAVLTARDEWEKQK